MQWHQLDDMQTIYTLLQTDNHINTSSLKFYRPQSTEGIQNPYKESVNNEERVIVSTGD